MFSRGCEIETVRLAIMGESSRVRGGGGVLMQCLNRFMIVYNVGLKK